MVSDFSWEGNSSEKVLERDRFWFFDNLPALLKLSEVETLLGVSRKTIYDWKYRQKQLRIPEDLFIKFNRKLYIRTETLKRWMSSQNPTHMSR